jgi:hypothetical protein
MHLELALEDVSHGRSAEIFVGGIGSCQQGDIGGTIPSHEVRALCRQRSDLAAFQPATQQPGELRTAQAGQLDQVSSHHSSLELRQSRVMLVCQHAFEKTIHGQAFSQRELDRPAALKKLTHLFNR